MARDRLARFRPPPHVVVLVFAVPYGVVLGVDALLGGLGDVMDAVLRATLFTVMVGPSNKPGPVDLLPTGLRVRGLHDRTMKFRYVEGVEVVDGRRGGRRVVVRMPLERVVLPSPRHVPFLWPDRGLDAKVARIEQARLAAREGT